jgi:hypothetical protein
MQKSQENWIKNIKNMAFIKRKKDENIISLDNVDVWD